MGGKDYSLLKIPFPSLSFSNWGIVDRHNTWPQWGPSVQVVECRNRFIRQRSEGRVKTVSGIPATGHRVEPQDDGLCKLTFEVPLLAAPYVYICKITLDRISGILE